MASGTDFLSTLLAADTAYVTELGDGGLKHGSEARCDTGREFAPYLHRGRELR